VQELRPGLWTWTARHPDWTPDEEWEPEVRSYAIARGDEILLFDPLKPPPDLIRNRNVEIVLTAEWHRRSSAELAAPIHRIGEPLPDGVEERPAFFPQDRVLWLPEERALILGDSLMYAKAIPDAWLGESSREDYNAKLRPLLELPFELLLPTHGDPIVGHARAHLERQLGHD
jgi:hypothetical protein